MNFVFTTLLDSRPKFELTRQTLPISAWTVQSFLPVFTALYLMHFFYPFTRTVFWQMFVIQIKVLKI